MSFETSCLSILFGFGIYIGFILSSINNQLEKIYYCLDDIRDNLVEMNPNSEEGEKEIDFRPIKQTTIK